MALQDKYKELTDAAATSGVSNLQVREQDGVLYIDGVAPSGSVKDQLWTIYETTRSMRFFRRGRTARRDGSSTSRPASSAAST